MAFVRLRNGVSAAAGLASVQRAASGASQALAATPASYPCHRDTLTALPVQHPAQISNYRTMNATPALLAVGLIAGAVAALGLTLFASVRSRRRDLAGPRRSASPQHQVAAMVAWQAAVAAIIGIAAGVPSASSSGGGYGTHSPGKSTRCQNPPSRSARCSCFQSAPWSCSTWRRRCPAGPQPAHRPLWPCAPNDHSSQRPPGTRYQARAHMVPQTRHQAPNEADAYS